jgi:hypothetical protein
MDRLNLEPLGVEVNIPGHLYALFLTHTLI